MDISPPVLKNRQLIQAYGDNGFRIADQRYDHPVIVMPDRTVPWTSGDVAAITPDSLNPLRNAEPPVELLLIGCGRSIAFVQEDLRQALRDWGIVIDAMDTGAACRTYNVLLTEERRVAAALIPIA